MAKRKTNDVPEVEPEGDGRLRIVKVRLSDEEIKVLRVAAALSDIPMATYLRNVALERAAKDIADFGMPKMPLKKKD